ncbi:MAG: epoxyqueuosine reductase QueH [Candidatus Omnitrophica bacterium]|nr:epoxyqueuosine reductase QueH [Candidatus Omnitrophota bacterium]
MSKALLHICCGPCAIQPVSLLKEEGFEVEGFFYNPNIHPFSEYRKRYEAVVIASERMGLSVIYHKYDFEEFIRKISCIENREEQHSFCWRIRLQEAARVAREKGIESFTTTLLASPYQDVGQIKALGQEVAAKYGLNFLARDFRSGFAASHKASKEWLLYHQNYCGCIYSEKESIEQREKRRKI